MKCTSKAEYDCYYLSIDNIEKFIEWISKYTIVSDYKNLNGYLLIHLEDTIFYVFKLGYNRWYVFKNKRFYGYSSEYFFKHYNVIFD